MIYYVMICYVVLCYDLCCVWGNLCVFNAMYCVVVVPSLGAASILVLCSVALWLCDTCNHPHMNV